MADRNWLLQDNLLMPTLLTIFFRTYWFSYDAVSIVSGRGVIYEVWIYRIGFKTALTSVPKQIRLREGKVILKRYNGSEKSLGAKGAGLHDIM
jgi:hypothetical protein